jgi:hypothetical protein
MICSTSHSGSFLMMSGDSLVHEHRFPCMATVGRRESVVKLPFVREFKSIVYWW